MYKFNNIPISEYGALPSPQNEYLALTGQFSLPKRKGKTEHNWGVEIEPYIEENDIELDGRTLTFSALIKADEFTLKSKVENFVNACLICKEISTDYDTFRVFCRDRIEVREHGDFAIITARFWQENVEMRCFTSLPPPVQTQCFASLQIDEYDLRRQFGIIISEKSSLESIAKRIESQTTEFYTKTQYRELTTARIECAMIGSSVSDLYEKITQFQALLYKPELRLLKLPYNGQIYFANVYFKDGFTARIEHETIIRFSLNAVVVDFQRVNAWQKLRLTGNNLLRRISNGNLRIAKILNFKFEIKEL